MAISEEQKVRCRRSCSECGLVMRVHCAASSHKRCRPKNGPRSVRNGLLECSVCKLPRSTIAFIKAKPNWSGTAAHGYKMPCNECRRPKQAAAMRAWRRTPSGDLSTSRSMTAWHKKNPTYERVRSRRRYREDENYRLRIHEASNVRRRNLDRALSPAEIKEVFALTEGECLYCGDPATTIDHYIPLARGGKHEVSNLVPACRRCNCKKSTKLPSEFLAREAA